MPSIQIGFSAQTFAGQKGRKLFIPVQITLSGASGFLSGHNYVVRFSYMSSATQTFFSIPAIPGTWSEVPRSGLALATVESSFNPNFIGQLSLPVFPAFKDPTNLTLPDSYGATYLIEVFDTSQAVPINSMPVVLSGSASPAQSVDVVFALDHGSSMTQGTTVPSRLDRLKSAFPRGVALLRGDDRLAVTSFANLGSNPLDSPSLPSDWATQTQRDLAIGLGNGLARDQTAFGQKSIQLATEAAHAWSPTSVVVLVTDGAHNNPGHPLTNPSFPTSAMIIGDAILPPSSATKMVSSDGHYLYAATQALGDFRIEKLLTQWLIDLSGRNFVSDPDGALEPGASQSFPLHITEADSELEVVVFSNDAAALQVRVDDLPVDETHHHRQQEPCDDPPEEDPIRGKGFVITRRRIRTLLPRDRVAPTVIVCRPSPSSYDAPPASYDALPSSYDAPPPPPVHFSLLVVAKTDLMLDAELTASGLSVGSDLLFSALLSEYGQAWDRPGPGVSMRVELFHPDGGVQMLHLDHAAPGRYQKSLRSFRAGTYTAHFIATGQSLLHQRAFRRECVRTVAVFPPSDCCAPEPDTSSYPESV